MKRTRTIVAIVVAVFVLSTAVFATAPWLKLFKDTYKPAAGSDLAKAGCGICHVKANGTGGLNAYGKMLKGKAMTAASLKAIEKKDADGDKVTNIKEIKAGKLPGDKNSKP